MKKLLVFVGESGSGKTTIIAELVRRFPSKFKKVVTYTSRPPRVGEVDGVDYHFHSEAYFVNGQGLVLVKKTEEGYYGTREADLSSDTYHLLLTSKLTGVQKLVDLGFKNITVVCISINQELRAERMRQRGDTEEMVRSRLGSDDFNGVNVDTEITPVIELI